MDLSWEERSAALKKLYADSDRFWAQSDAKANSVPDLIEKFLNSTDSPLPEGEILTHFAGGIYNRLGWSGFCQACECMLARDPDPEAKHGTYAVWIVYGEGAMTDSENLSLEERVRVATDVEAIIERAAEETGYCPETTLGYFYYDHPLKGDQPQLYLLKAKEWFERMIESQDDEAIDHHDLQYLGHVHFELGDFKSALHWYKKLEAVHNQCGETCVMDRKLAEKRLAECRQRLTE